MAVPLYAVETVELALAAGALFRLSRRPSPVVEPTRRERIDAVGASALAAGFSILFPFSCLFPLICLGADDAVMGLFVATSIGAGALALAREAPRKTRALEWALFLYGLRVLAVQAIQSADDRYHFFLPHTFDRHPPPTFLGDVVGGPMFEEQLCRGVLLGALTLWIPEVPAVLLAAAIFAALHPYGLAGNGVVFVDGVVFGLAWRRGGCSASTVDHALANLTPWLLHTGLAV